MSRKKTELADAFAELHKPLDEGAKSGSVNPFEGPRQAAPVKPGWLCSPDKPGIYLQQVGNDLVAKVVRQGDIDSRFFDRCGLWYRLDVPLP
jgi:hypothetical protein